MATRKFNFSPGPAMIPTDVMNQVQEELLNWQGAGISSMEDTHRGARFSAVMDSLERTYRELLGVPDNYSLLFAQGGATLQSALLPFNILGDGRESSNSAGGYAITGAWSQKAHAEAQAKWNAPVTVDLKAENYSRFPRKDEWNIPADISYLHYCNNETIHGIYGDISDWGLDIPLVCDASSCILGRDINVDKHDMIYAGAQKNLGPAGIAVSIISDKLLKQAREDLPIMMSWKKQIADDSMQNTAPTFTLYVMELVARWTAERGGVPALEKENRHKASLIYGVIDASSFYISNVEVASRSIHNIPFILADEALNDKFLEEAAAADLVNLKGHRMVGGMRASMYNSMPVAGAEALAEFMIGFEQRNV